MRHERGALADGRGAGAENAAGDIFLASAGVRRGERDPFVDAVLAEEGISLGDRHPRSVDDLDDAYFDLIITLSPEAHHAALEFTRSMSVDVEYWPMPDPTTITGTREQIMAAYRDVRERLKVRIGSRFLPPDTPSKDT